MLAAAIVRPSGENATCVTPLERPLRTLIPLPRCNSQTETPYDAFGHRIGASHNGIPTRHLFDPNSRAGWAAEFDAGGSKTAAYYYGYGLLERKSNAGDPAFYTFSAIGHRAELTDNAGDTLNTYAFDPWGNPIRHEVTVPNPFESVGEFGVAAEDSGLLLMQGRHYSAEVGRFLQTDPIGALGGINLYSYVRNQPVSMVDPTGLSGTIGIGTGPGSLSYGWNSQTGEKCICGAFGIGIPLPSVFVYGAAGGNWGFNAGIPDIVDISYNSTAPTHGYYVGGWIAGGVGVTGSKTFGQSGSDFGGGVGFGGGAEAGGCFCFGGGGGGGAGGGGRDGDGSSNTATSFDPNDKLAPAGYGEASFVQLGGALLYEVMFENRGDATAPAREVVVTDPLDPNLDIDTLQLFEVSFANQTLSIPAGLDHYASLVPFASREASVFVDVQAGLNYDNRTLTLRLNALDPLTGWFPEDALVGLLYPEDGSGRGQGHITSLVSPRAGTPTGTVITNRASVVFDYNDPVATPLVFNTIDAGAPSSRLSAITPPALGTNTFTVFWTASDDPGGSGVASVDIYGSTNGTNYVRWVEGATNAVTLSGQPGATYYLFTVAHDNVGNEEARSQTPDATVHIPLPPPDIADATLTPDGKFRLSVAGSAGVVFDVEASEDLVTWTRIGTVTGSSAGTVEFTDPDAAGRHQRFYRLKSP